MVIDSLRVVLFLAGGTAAAAATAYVTGAVDLLFPQPQPRTELAAVPPAANPPAAEPPAATPPVAVPAPSDPKPAEPPVVDVKPDLPLPAFDLVRVEPDGSLVIAGTAAPKSRVEVFSEKRVWGAHSATPEGDFAVVCEDRLAPGDYAIKIRSITEDGTELISAQTAIVSIPATPDGEVLAMVEEEGRPSKIITAPSAPAEPEKPVEVAVAPAEPAPAEPEKPAEVVAAPAEPAPDEPEKPAEVVAAPAEPAPAEPEKPAEVVAAPAEPAPAEPEKPAEVVAAPEQPAPAEPEKPAEVVAAPAEPEPAEPEKPVEVAAAPAEPEAPEVVNPPVPAPAVRPVVVVEAVEIEGSRVFIAGKADKGFTVRAYANELLLGDSEVSDGGRFLVEAEQDLPVGHYIMRADLIDAKAQVVARAAVPFDREPGEAVAAVAPPAEPAPEPKKPEEVVEAPAPEPRPDVVAEAPRPEPKPEQPAEIAAPAEPEKPAEIVSAPVEPKMFEEPVEPEKPAEVVAAPPAPAPAQPEKPAEVVEAPAEPAPAEPEKPVEVAAAPAEPEAPEVTQPKLQNVTGAVIIRRGDTLWRISRRVYGKGIRYSTIYVANKPQIADPDRIWPGQVFAVPGESTDGEKADWSAIADQMQQDTPETATR